MFVRRGPAIMLSLVLGAAALVSAPSALARDGEIAKDIDSCQGPDTSTYKLKVTTNNANRLEVTGIVWSDDEDLWEWKFKHNDDGSDDGVVRATDGNKSFKIVRTMVDIGGPDAVDTVVFRAENSNTHEVCRGEVNY